MSDKKNEIDVYLPLCWGNRNLAELREAWERFSQNSWHLYRHDGELIVLVERSTGYSLNRYFDVGGNWLVSVDVRDGSLDEALSEFESQKTVQE